MQTTLTEEVMMVLPPCPCGRNHSFMYRDRACTAARRRERIVTEAAIESSRRMKGTDFRVNAQASKRRKR